MKLLSKRSIFSSHNQREQFYKSLIVKNTLQSSYHCLTNEQPEMVDTYQDIVYKELPWGSGSREVINLLGSPRYKMERLNDLTDHQILFFKREILGEKAILQCHFIDNQLYFIHIDFLSSLSRDLGSIHDVLLKKYMLPGLKQTQTTCIKDCFQNKLIITNDVTLSLSYISGTASIIRLFEKKLEAKLASQSKKFANSFSEL